MPKDKPKDTSAQPAAKKAEAPTFPPVDRSKLGGRKAPDLLETVLPPASFSAGARTIRTTPPAKPRPK